MTLLLSIFALIGRYWKVILMVVGVVAPFLWATSANKQDSTQSNTKINKDVVVQEVVTVEEKPDGTKITITDKKTTTKNRVEHEQIPPAPPEWSVAMEVMKPTNDMFKNKLQDDLHVRSTVGRRILGDLWLEGSMHFLPPDKNKHTPRFGVGAGIRLEF